MKLLHHTSNGLESYNKVFNAICLTKHPNLAVFVHALCGEADCVIQRMDNVDKGREQPPCYNEPVFPDLTPAFLA